MDQTPQKSQKFFLLFIIAIGILVIFGLIWAVTSGSTETDVAVGEFTDAASPKIGAEHGALTVHLFEDYQCPACRSAEAGFRYAVQTYGDRVTFVWKDFPLVSIHANAVPAANAARCANEQGKFWEYHDRLYDDQSAWSELPNPSAQFANYASALGLDTEAFASCYAERRYDADVRADLRDAERLRLNSTPTAFIGDQKFSGVLSPEQWDRAIQDAFSDQ